MFLLVPTHPGSSGQRAVKRLLLLLLPVLFAASSSYGLYRVQVSERDKGAVRA